LIDRHLSNAVAHEEETSLLRNQKESLDSKVLNLKEKLDNIQKELDVACSVHKDAAEEWTHQV